MPLKTDLFSSREFSEELFNDLIVLQNLEKDSFSKFKDWFGEQDSLPRLNDISVKTFVKELDSSPKKVHDSIAALYGLIRLLAINDIEVDAFIHDLKLLNEDVLIDEKNLEERIKSLKDLSDQYHIHIYADIAKKRGIPILKSSSSSIAIKPVIDNRSDRDDNIQEYSPNILGYVHNIIIRIETDRDNTGIDFQMSEDGFEDFLNSLIGLKIELNEAKKDI